ncbi:NADH-quinone oxidoreductase subunit M [Hydrogenivirga sp. 128-5-R1-1]|uniref:complex I subunit 4 family protein n=1 Tax=Hydrogenivirga sp. 128-5-R1-1 TaxID=392423 RepID=UPI00015F3764|nr:NADH-quinone oxidoreductase subunit M [Hydrogenivirga sp. 128-5-R1-1]EDP76501.1 NADH dehydrogenase I chain M [Hydrogenivirga sp. 128-5-R1-1]
MDIVRTDFPFISLSLVIPALFALAVVFVPERFIRAVSLLGAGLTFLVSLCVLYLFDYSRTAAVQFYEEYVILEELRVKLSLGLDGLSLLMYFLTTLVSLVAIVWSVRDRQISFRLREYFFAFLMTESFLVGVFASFDVLVFYVFYELTLIPMLFAIGVWGYKLRLYSAYKFFIYIFASSLFLLLGIASVAVVHFTNKGTFSFSYFDLLKNSYTPGLEIFIFLLFFIAFAVKTPLVPFHTWLPDAHGEAPTAGSVVLAAILLKMGTYALLRFNIGLFPDATVKLMPFMVAIGIITIIYASWMTIVQNNIKRFVAYSSVSHMGFVVTAMFLLNHEGLRASVMEMFAHGMTSASLFMIAGFIYGRLHTFNMENLRGSVKFMPVFAVIVATTAFAAMGLPGGSSFWGKFLTMLAAKEYSYQLALLVLAGGFFSAAYVLFMLKTLFLDVKEESILIHFTDVRGFKLASFVMLVVPILVIGFFPHLFFNMFEGSIGFILKNLLGLE